MPLVEKLLAHFDDYTTLPIDVNDVRERLIEMGVQDEILFHFVKMDSRKIRGILHRYIKHARPYAEPTFCSDICIAEDQGEESDAWQRLVAVKEMLHISDCENLTAASEDAVDNLFVAFALPPDVRDPEITDKRSVLNDRMRTYIALAILIPRACRDHLRQLYPQKLSDLDVALMAMVPERYIPLIMDHNFEHSLGVFLKWEAEKQA
jgi:hypothetical protein